jgi:hypothetical protein
MESRPPVPCPRGRYEGGSPDIATASSAAVLEVADSGQPTTPLRAKVTPRESRGRSRRFNFTPIPQASETEE